MHTDALIIGGGIAGLACGVGLAGSGLRVVVAERSAELGGRARRWVDRETGDVVDIGPHILLSEYRNMLRLLEMLGTRERIAWRTDRFITLYERPHAVPIRTGRLPAPLHFVRSVVAAPAISMADANSNARTTWTAMLLLAGDWTRTAFPACMESAVRSGWLAAEQVLAEAGRPRRFARRAARPGAERDYFSSVRTLCSCHLRTWLKCSSSSLSA